MAAGEEDKKGVFVKSFNQQSVPCVEQGKTVNVMRGVIRISG